MDRGILRCEFVRLSFVFGVLGGCLAIVLGVVLVLTGLFFGAIWAAIGFGPASEVAGGAYLPAGVAIVGGVLGIVGGVFGKAVGGALMIIGGVMVLIGNTLFSFRLVPFVFMLAGGILAIKEKTSELPRSENKI